MTAIIMAGRSGAAFAAELGTMQVCEEIDALETMGISPVPYLVMPRILALVARRADARLARRRGGCPRRPRRRGHSLTSRRRATSPSSDALVASDVWTGLVKSVAFAGAIGVIACQEGLAARGAAAGSAGGRRRPLS